MTFSRQTSSGYLINHLARLFAGALQEGIKPLGLSTGVFPIMVHLWDQDGLTQKELVDRVGIEQATMAKTLARMERDNLILRRADKDDRRVRRAWLTQHGETLRDPALTVAVTQNALVLAGLSAEEQNQVVQLVSKAIDAFEAQQSQDVAGTDHA
ncbi:MarR family winged helix-turn-helix transcriptional regulator [Shimia sediminis]|uniref:MarR family winged helix-turn-helix transcriptional regulator n=1 Tax=Shimia sediminis TaxID=2497945 RepID=UPI000F8D4538|nr:MarR family transcriptional regulator [Shimia sediminis]